jgi:hypothetical protein
MQTSWQIRRTVIARQDGERRWDEVYQFLLRWAMEHDATRCLAPEHQQEESHGNRPVWACVDHPSPTSADQ